MDTTLVAGPDGLRPRAVGYDLVLPLSLADGPAAVSTGDVAATVGLDGAADVDAVVEGSTVTYPGVLPGVDVELVAAPEGLRTFALLTGPEATTDLPWRVESDQPVDAAPDGSATIGGEDGLLMPVPYAEDAAGDVLVAEPEPDGGPVAVPSAGDLTDALTADVVPDGGGVAVGLEVAPEWLADPDREFPVRVDPSLLLAGTAGGQADDCHLVQTQPDTSFCETGTVEIGRTAGIGVRRALFDFDVSSIAPGSSVHDATLRLYTGTVTTGATQTANLHEVVRPWARTATTWNTVRPGLSWNLPGLRVGGSNFDARGEVVAREDLDPVTGSYQEFEDVGPLVRGWVADPDANFGMLVKKADEGPEGLYRYGSADHPEVAKRPRLFVYWTPSAGQRPYDTIINERLNDRTTVGVNAATGNLIVRQQDTQVTGNGLDLTLERAYNSLNAYHGVAAWDAGLDYSNRFGLGWSSPVFGDTTLNYSVGDNVATMALDGDSFTWQRKAGGGWTRPAGLQADFSPNDAQRTATVTFRDSGDVYTFDEGLAGYLLMEIRDRNGNRIDTFTGADGDVIDTRGRTFATTETGTSFGGDKRIARISGPTGRQLSYGYGTTSGTPEYGLLLQHTNPDGGTTQYDYTADQQLWKITGPGGSQVRVWYDSRGRVDRVWRMTSTSGGTSGNGYATTYTYLEDRTEVTDARGNTTTYRLDDADEGRIDRVTDARGMTRDTKYTSNGEITSITSSAAGARTASYDANGRLKDTKASTGATTTLDYGSSATQFQPTSVTDPNGNTTQISYDGSGNQLQTTAPGGETSRTVRNSDGSLKATTRPAGIGTEAGNPRGECAAGPNGSTADNCTHYAYAPNSTNPTTITVTPPRGSRWSKASVYTLDGLSRTVSVRDGRGVTATNTYDGLDRVLSTRYSDATPTVTYTYDGAGNVLTATQGGVTTTSTYDILNRLTSRQVTGRPTTGYGYDQVDNLTGLNVSGWGATTYSYDTVNNAVRVDAPDGGRYTLGYDGDGRRERIQFPNGAFEMFGYDGDGRMTKVRAYRSDGTTRYHDYTYCYTGPPAGQAHPAEPTGCTTGDAARDRADVQWRRDELAAKTTVYEYDTSSRLTRARDDGTQQFRYVYDANANVTRRERFGQATLTRAYDPSDALCVERSDGQTASCSTTATSTSVSPYTYDKAGNPITRRSAALGSYDGDSRTTGYAGTSYAYEPGTGQADRTTSGTTQITTSALGVAQTQTSAGAQRYTVLPDGTLLGYERPDGSDHYYLHDRQGTILGTVDAAQNRSATYAYGPYGEPTLTTGPAAAWQPHRWLADYTDPNGLTHIGIRYYDPDDGVR